MKDYYKILGVPPHATREEIKSAYRKLAYKHHPDKNGSHDTQQFLEINEAKQVLLDFSERMKYEAQFAQQQAVLLRKRTILQPFLALAKTSNLFTRMKIAAATFGISLISISFFIGSTSMNAEVENLSMQRSETNQADVQLVQTAQKESGVIINEAIRSRQQTATIAHAASLLHKSAVRIANKAVPPSAIAHNNQNKTITIEKAALLVQSGKGITTRNFSIQEMEQILTRLRKTFPAGNNNGQCLQLRKTRNCNIENAFELAEYLRMNGYSIGGRKLVDSNSQGVDIHESEACIVLTVGFCKP